MVVTRTGTIRRAERRHQLDVGGAKGWGTCGDRRETAQRSLGRWLGPWSWHRWRHDQPVGEKCRREHIAAVTVGAEGPHHRRYRAGTICELRQGEDPMKRMIRRVLLVAPLATLASWLVPVAAHAGFTENHNETLVRVR